MKIISRESIVLGKVALLRREGSISKFLSAHLPGNSMLTGLKSFQGRLKLQLD